MQLALISFLSTAVVGSDDFWSKINDESMESIHPSFRQMIQSSCEMITLGRAGYPNNIPRETVEKLCMKLYPPFATFAANQGKKSGAGTSEPAKFSIVNAAVLVVMILGIISYVVLSSALEKVAIAQPPLAWEINRLASDAPTPSASQAQVEPSPTGPAGVLSSPEERIGSWRLERRRLLASAAAPASLAARSPPSPDASAPLQKQLAELRRARLKRFDSHATEQS